MPDAATELAAAVGQTLPAAYLAFLDGLSSRPTLGEGYTIPKHWRFTDAFPLTVTGKVQKYRLRELAAEEWRRDKER